MFVHLCFDILSTVARKKNNSKRSKSSKKKKDEELDETEVGAGLAQDTKYWIGVTAVIVLAVISFLSLFDLAGPIGKILSIGLTRLFGWGDFLIPFLLIWFSWVMIKRRQHLLHSIHYWGAGLFVFSFYGLLHWTQNGIGLVEAISLGRGGGYVGLALSWPLSVSLGSVAGVIVTIAIFIISVLLLFDASSNSLFGEYNIFKRTYLNARHRIMDVRYGDDDGYVSDEEYEDDYSEEDEENYESDEVDIEEGDEEGDEGDDGLDDKEPTSDKNESHSEQRIDSIQKTDSSGKQGELIKTSRRKMPKIDIPLALFKGKPGKPNSGDIRANQDIIERTLETFGIPVDMGEVNIGPTVTQYTFRPAEGIKVNKIMTLQNDLALALAAHSVRIEAPIPGKSLVGIEIPNQTKAIVTLRELFMSSEFKNKRKKSSLMLPLGKDVSGRTYVSDLASMPHLLIAGTTGSGKSIAINAILTSLMYQNQPTDLKFILVDPKRVELTAYENIPYLITPVITEYKKTVGALRWATNEMDRRYSLLSRAGYKHISTYNSDVGVDNRLPNIVIVIDELADLMSAASADIEAPVVRIAQMARAVGMHLILATQRPSVDVITGLIKANFPSRMAFSVTSIMDSRTILDVAGAEKLLGKGDMLFSNPELPKPRRLQGAFISEDEIRSIGQYLRGKAKPDFLSEVTADVDTGSNSGSGDSDDDSDPLMNDAKEVILSAGKASASLLQRRLRVGYSRAARILDILESQGFVGPAEGSKPREVFGDSVETKNNTDSAEEDLSGLDSDEDSDYSDDGYDDIDEGADADIDSEEFDDSDDLENDSDLDDDYEEQEDEHDNDDESEEDGEWDEETESYK